MNRSLVLLTGAAFAVGIEEAGVLVTAGHGAFEETSVRTVLGSARVVSGGSPAKLV
jgi:hypothetical protein